MKTCSRCGTSGSEILPTGLCRTCDTPDEKSFINLAIKRSVVTFEQIQECLALQQTMKATLPDIKIWDVLVLRKYATQDQVQAVLSGKEEAKGFTFGAYKIQRKIGEGGMGAVYLAKKEGQDALFALKVLPERFSSDESRVKRFEREAKVLITLSHPNLVKGYEHGKANNRWYYAMEFVKGKVLIHFIREKKRLTEREAVEIALQVALALKEIHKHGLVHRDIKPENIIIDESGTAKVMDLGLVKSSTTEMTALTQSGYAMGTLHYMSPEQLKGRKQVDIRCDIYALGATLYHMVTGRQPFEGKTMMEVMNRQLRSELEDPRAIHPELSEGLCAVIERMMALDPADRYQNPDALVRDLSGLLDGTEPDGARLAAGRSMIRRIPAAKPAAPASRRPPQRQAPNRAVLWTVLGIGGAAAIIIIIVAAASRPVPIRPAPGHVQDKPISTIEPTIRRHLEFGEWNLAADLLTKESGTLDPERARELAGQLERAVADSWSGISAELQKLRNDHQFDQARSTLERFNLRASEIPWAQQRIKAESDLIEREQNAHQQRLADAGRAQERRLKSDETWRRLERELAASETPGAMAILRKALAESDDPDLRDRIQHRLRLLEDEAKRKPASVPPAPPPPPPKAHPLWVKAQAQVKAAQWGDAIASLSELLKEAPSHPEAQSLRALSFLRKGNRLNARLDAQQALSRNAQDPRARFVLGVCLLKEKQFTYAVRELTAAIAGDSGNAEAYYSRAQANAELQIWEDVVADLREASRLSPDLGSRPETALLTVRALEGSDKPDEAVQEASRWIDRNKKDVAMLLKRAGLYSEQGKPKEALADYERVLAIEPKNEEALRGKAETSRSSRPAPKPPAAPKALTPAKKLEAEYNAAREQFTNIADGKARTTLLYDFADKEQIKDFRGGAVQGDRCIELPGSLNRAAFLLFKSRLIGDYLIRIEFAYLDEASEGTGLILRSTDSGDSEGEGIGIALLRQFEWAVELQRHGTRLSSLSDSKSVAVKTNERAAIGLRRQAGEYTGWFGSATVNRQHAGFESGYLRLICWDRIRILRIEIQGTIEADTSKPGSGESAKELWTGTGLDQNWKVSGSSISAEAGTLTADVPDIAYIVHKEWFSGNSVRYEMTATVDAIYGKPGIGVVLQTGDSIQGAGDVLGVLGGRLNMYRYERSDWETLKRADPTNSLDRKEYKIELIVQGSAVTLRVHGEGEVHVADAIKPGTVFRPGIVVQGLKVRIGKFTQTSGAAERAKAPSSVPGSSGGALFNGKDVRDWDAWAGEFKVEKNAIVADGREPSVLTHKDAATGKSARYEMTLLVDEIYTDKASVGFGAFRIGDTPLREGSLTAVVGKNFVLISRIRSSTEVDTLQRSTPRAGLSTREITLELIIENGDLTVRIAGGGEATAKSALPADTRFQPAIWVSDARVRITRFVQK